MLRKKEPEDKIQEVIDKIHAQAIDLSLPDPLISSTDAYVTSICYIGSKSLSHLLSCIERCKDRLLAIGPTSPAARRQIITSVMEYWKDQPGIGVNIVDKLLNYTILSPGSVIEWALSRDGAKLGQAFVYEMVNATVGKVTTRVRQVTNSKNAQGLDEEQRALLVDTVERERKGMKDLFALMEDSLTGWASGTKDQTMEGGLGDSAEEAMIRQWGARWLRVFRRKSAVEEAWFLEAERIKEEEIGEEAQAMKVDGPGEGDALVDVE